MSPEYPRAHVRPRVIAPDLGEAVLLEDEIRQLLDRGFTGLVSLVGPPGSGKRTATLHLKAIFGSGIYLVSGNDIARPPDRLKLETRLSAGSARSGKGDDLRDRAHRIYHMASWTRDELIEYMLAVRPERCASVMQRIAGCPDLEILSGNPEICRIVLNAMAGNDAYCTVADALISQVLATVPSVEALGIISRACLLQVVHLSSQDVESVRPLTFLAVHDVAETHCPGVAGLFWHETVNQLFAAEQLLLDLKSDDANETLESRLPEQLVRDVAARIDPAGPIETRLRDLFVGRQEAQPMVASLLHAMGASWRPATLAEANLNGAYLNGCQWPDAVMPSARLCDADLTHANLDRAYLNMADLRLAKLSYASLEQCTLSHSDGRRADFSRANLRGVVAKQAMFWQASFAGANMSQGVFLDATFDEANLRRAKLTKANLTGAQFRRARFQRCDLRGAQLRGAWMEQADLRRARLHAADFEGADLHGCNLEGVFIKRAVFRKATLIESLLTGSRMPRADFRGADLEGAYLAEIDWEEADLRDADLTGAVFHMGSSRSGLVDSPYACEGSRTGFYTDDYNDRDYKPPEEIRKANLRGADLRGANIRGVDFYLVDLRDARYDPAQLHQLRQTGAILEHQQMS